jgi:hypothetical protein
MLINTGNADAHNVSVKVQAFCGDSAIHINGRDSLDVYIGTLQDGGSITKQADMSFNVIDGLRISQRGAHLLMTIFSDEYTKIMYYDYKP